jgi:protein subunit release factor A
MSKLKSKGVEMNLFLEIRAAEGGEDSCLFVDDLLNAYQKLSTKIG